ncbi:MAG TPA: phosphoenolpyruvate carboxylase [Vicinamibacterales bacterium]|nr:phosphoenolpyruvate carboxylase [Vicinamibacterales bacterium]
MADAHAPLRDDIHLLGDLLGERLRVSEGQDLFDTVERVRALSKAAHGETGDAAFAELAALLAALPAARALTVARAFSHFLTLANVAEQHHRIRRRRDYQRDPSASPQPASFDETFARLIRGGVSPERLHAAVGAMSVELVFTAHPTEITRRTLIHAYARIADLLSEHDRPDLTAQDRDTTLDELRQEIAIVWGTDEVRQTRPTPLDEVRWGLAVFEQTLWDAVPQAYRALDRALVRHTGRSLGASALPIRFGSWIGGDRDGNPHVTPDVTRRATLMARWVAANLFERNVDALVAELSFETGSERLHDHTGASREPYRALLHDVRDRLRLTRTQLAEAIESGATRIDEPIPTEELRAALALCHSSLVDTRNEVVANGRLLDAMRRAQVFGLALVPLDIRQEADKHAEAIDALSGGEYLRLDEQGRQRWLIDRLERPVRLKADATSVKAHAPNGDVLDTLRIAAALHRDSLGAYVITMAGAPSDVLEVEYLQQIAGVAPRMRVVPLFETGADLRAAPAVLRDLLAIPWYRARIDAGGGRQEVMVGYSDSSKDAGRFAAAWDLYRAQEEIVNGCRASGVQLTLFHGRGGSVGRGGGPTYLAIQSQPPGSVDGTIRVTEQGEMLQAKFGLTGIAVRTLEVYVSATLDATLVPPAAPPAEFRAELDRFVERSRAAYRRTIEDARFLEYFREATPERELELTNIGSRPARRGSSAKEGVEGLRAIPWQFSWTQTRLLLASWLGVEAAFAGDTDLDRARRMYAGWPFFRSAVDLIEMVLAKADARIAAEYDRRLVREELQDVGRDLRRRLESAIRAVLGITNHAELVGNNRVLRRSIDVRNPYVDPINLVQIELLRRLRAGTNGGTESAFVATVNGVAAGMRNTG